MSNKKYEEKERDRAKERKKVHTTTHETSELRAENKNTQSEHKYATIILLYSLPLCGRVCECTHDLLLCKMFKSQTD